MDAQTAYICRSQALVIEDSPEHIDFHIKTGDYFAFLSTAMSFIEERLGACGPGTNEEKLAKDLRSDLSYVHKNYRIIPKDEA
jgi:hypothetical protein